MFFSFLSIWIRGLLSVALVITGVLLIKEWIDDLPREATIPVTATGPGEAVSRPLTSLGDRLDAWRADPDRSMAPLVWGALCLLFAVGGRMVTPRLWLRGRKAPSVRPVRTERLETRSGHRLHVELYGPDEAPPLILVHGVGSDRTQWLEAIEDLSGSFRVLAYDLQGHGLSSHAANADYSLEAMARDLDDVMKLTGRDRVLVAGHSMGGMIALTWCRLHGDKAKERLSGLVLVHTTPVNPFKTMAPVPLHETLRKPIHDPLIRLTRALSPVVKIMNRLSYWNGSTHWMNAFQAFAGCETREQLDRSARLYARFDPATVARCCLAMMRYDATGTLGSIDVPTLVVGGSKDQTTVPHASVAIADAISGAELLVLEPTRHMGFMEQRENFAEEVAHLGRGAEKERETKAERRSTSPRRRKPRAVRHVPVRP